MPDFMLMADISIGAINSDDFWQVMFRTLKVKTITCALNISSLDDGSGYRVNSINFVWLFKSFSNCCSIRHKQMWGKIIIDKLN